MPRSFISLCLSLTLILGTSALAEVPDLAGGMQRVEQLLREGQRGAAKSLLEKLLTAHPKAFEAHVRYQNLLLEEGERQELARRYRDLARTEKSARASFLYARLLKGRRAIAAYRSILEREPEFVRAWLALAAELRRANRLDLAEQAAGRAVQIDPRDARAHDALGRVLEQRGKLGEAEKAYAKSLELAPRLLSPRFRLAHLMVRTRRHKEALSTIGEAVRIAPGDVKVYIHLGLVLAGVGRPKDSIRAYAQAFRRAGEDPLVFVLVARSLSTLREWPLALRATDEALKRNRNFAPAHAARGYVHLMTGATEEAERSFETATDLAPGRADYRYYLGLIHDRRGELAAAERCYRAAIKMDPQTLSYHLAVGAVQEKRGRPRAALRHYRKTAKEFPNAPGAWIRIGYLEIKLGRFRSAEKAFRAALDRDPDNVKVLLALGILYRTKLRDSDEALDALRLYRKKGGKDERVDKWIRELEDSSK